MADSFTIEVDTAPLERALNQLGAVAQPFINDASAVSAASIVREAKARLRRQLGPAATGQTEAAISHRPAYDGNGQVVVVERSHMPNLPLWIERGTKKGRPGSHASTARPFFYPAAQLEVGAHVRRLTEALSAAIASQGLGE